MAQPIQMRYSEAFVMQVVADLESGRMDSIEAVRRHYGIGGCSTIQRWLRKYGRNALLPKVVRVEKPDEASQLTKMRRRVAQLEQALGQTQAENVLNGQYLLLACEQLGQDAESFKKQNAGVLCTKPAKMGG
jgi:transposase-like protein